MKPFNLCVLAFLLITATAAAQPTTGNLLRNADFQDDWMTVLPETKNHHWCYTSEVYHRRDFNPDGWWCKGSWRWLNADQPAGQRKLVLQGPGASVVQRVNWVLVFDSRTMGNMADAGGFPAIKPQRSIQPLRVVRDLTFRVRLKGQDVPAKAGIIEVGLCPPGGITISDPFGSQTPVTTQVSLPLPEGTFASQSIEVKLPAEQWLKTVQAEAQKNPKEGAEVAKFGPLLPGTVRVAVHYQAKAGSIELEAAELLEATAPPANLLPNGGFEVASEKTSTMPAGWTGPSKYRYFPGRLYYIFNTWHNGAFDNRGIVRLDSLVTHSGRNSLQMIVPPGDEVAMSSQPIVLKQREPRLLEVRAFVKTDNLAMLNIDAVDENGDRLDGFTFITMAPHSIGTNDWRLIRQVFRPRRPVESVRLMLCARGVNGYTLDDTGHQPQNNVVGTIWWDDVQLHEPESVPEELGARGIAVQKTETPVSEPRIDHLDLGERMLGENILTGTLVNPDQKPRKLRLTWQFKSPSGKASSFDLPPVVVPARGKLPFKLPYTVTELCPDAYTEFHCNLTLSGDDIIPVASSPLSFATWTVPIDLELGALYLQPKQTQFVRMNLGFSAAAIKTLAKVKLDVIRRGTGQVVFSKDVPATHAVLEAQRQKIPDKLRDDFSNLLLADLDVSQLPVQPFSDPQRNFLVKATAFSGDGKVLGTAQSPPFCRLDHEAPQPPVQSVKIKKNLLYVNEKPWMPFGVIYGHCPVPQGPADPGKYIDLHNLSGWNMYDGYGSATYTRTENDFNCDRYVAASITPVAALEKSWAAQNKYGSTIFVVPAPVFSLEQLEKSAGGKDKLSKYLAFAKSAPMVVSTAPGIEEAFGLFHENHAEKLEGLEKVVAYLRQQTGKPVMVGHGGYWNRLEFEKVPFFDIFDPETEPLYPANLHTDLLPLVKGQDKAIWIRPQMYEDVPYERWRFHVYVELMRGCRGWQIAHGPGDASLFRGLHAELEAMKPIAYSQDPGPKIQIQPEMEHWSRRHNGKTYLIAATTRGMTLGHWRLPPAEKGVKPLRVTGKPHLHLSDANSYGADQKIDLGPSIYGIQYLPNAKTWPAGSKLVQTIRLNDKERPENLVAIVKANGRWIHAASWGKFDPSSWTSDNEKSLWFLRSFYRHAYGFLGWGGTLLKEGKQYMPHSTLPMGDLPQSGNVELTVPLDKIGIKADLLIDGIGFAHQGGRVEWGETALVDAAGQKTVIWGDTLEHPPEILAKTRISVPGLAKGAKVRVLFEDREITAEEGWFRDDFRGQDLYQRFGGGYSVGYGNGPVALHIYEIPG